MFWSLFSRKTFIFVFLKEQGREKYKTERRNVRRSVGDLLWGNKQPCRMVACLLTIQKKDLQGRFVSLSLIHI